MKKQQREELRQQLHTIASLALQMQDAEREALQLTECCSERSRNLYDPAEVHRQALQDLRNLVSGAVAVAGKMKPRGGAR